MMCVTFGEAAGDRCPPNLSENASGSCAKEQVGLCRWPGIWEPAGNGHFSFNRNPVDLSLDQTPLCLHNALF